MPRGGYYPHAERWGRKSAWLNASVTKTIRVPEALVEQVLDLAHKLDAGEVIAFETKSDKLDSGPNEEARGAEVDRLRSQLAALSEENALLQSQLDDQAAKAGEWYDKAKQARKERDELAHNLKQATSQQSHQQTVDLEAIRDRILAGLKVGKQASEYKRTKAALDRFINDLLI